ncbi:MAG: DEAD/DEAH box helicase [Bacteroidota bacterium]|nr:DEAD/DEAH box helicase [Bacteroidota bacterium]
MFKEKLHKKLSQALLLNGFEEPKALQLKCLPKINGGFDVIGIGPVNSGKSTLSVITAIQKLQYAFEDPPRALILVANKEKALAMLEQFNLLTKETDLRALAIFEEGKIDEQTVDIYAGVDLVIGTANRIMDIYFKRTLNLNKIKLFIIDDAQSMIDNRWQGQIDRLALSLPKCQHLVFTTGLNEKIEKLISKFIVSPQIIEVKEDL